MAVGPGNQLIKVKRLFHLSGWISQSATNWTLKGHQNQLGNDPFQKSPKAPKPFVSLVFHSFREPEGPPEMYGKCTENDTILDQKWGPRAHEAHPGDPGCHQLIKVKSFFHLFDTSVFSP